MKRSSFLLALLIAMSTLVSCKCSCKHQYQEWVVTTEATCEETGVMTRTCKKCNKGEEQTIVALGHDYGNLISGITPICEETGEIAHYQCSRCNKYFDEQKNEVSSLVLPIQHKLTKIFQKDATCYETGFIAHEHCEVCGKNFVDGEEKTDDEIKIVSTGHSFIENQKIEADCHTNGTKAHLHCDKCNNNFIKGVEVELDELVILASHDIIDIKEISNTCTENGVAAHTYCYVCGKNFIGEVDKTNMVYKLYDYQGLFVLEGNKLLEWTGEKYGLKYNITPVEYKINKDVVKVYTYNEISYADIYRMDGTTLRYNETVVAQYVDENTLSLGDVKYSIDADNKLSVIYEEEIDQSYKVVVRFNDSGKAYLITIITSPAASEVTERIEVYDWIEEDGIITLMTKDYILTQFIVNEDGTLSLDIR